MIERKADENPTPARARRKGNVSRAIVREGKKGTGLYGAWSLVAGDRLFVRTLAPVALWRVLCERRNDGLLFHNAEGIIINYFARLTRRAQHVFGLRLEQARAKIEVEDFTVGSCARLESGATPKSLRAGLVK